MKICRFLSGNYFAEYTVVSYCHLKVCFLCLSGSAHSVIWSLYVQNLAYLGILDPGGLRASTGYTAEICPGRYDRWQPVIVSVNQKMIYRFLRPICVLFIAQVIQNQ